MALQNLQQYGCQTGNKLKEKSRDLNRNSSRNKNETMFGKLMKHKIILQVLECNFFLMLCQEGKILFTHVLM
jgi:hypothetical protein